MLKNETLKELEKTFNYETELKELGIVDASSVEVVNLDLIRIHINDRIHPDDVGAAIVTVLKNNNEPGPLKVHVETARSYRATLYADIITI